MWLGRVGVLSKGCPRWQRAYPPAEAATQGGAGRTRGEASSRPVGSGRVPGTACVGTIRSSEAVWVPPPAASCILSRQALPGARRVAWDSHSTGHPSLCRPLTLRPATLRCRRRHSQGSTLWPLESRPGHQKCCQHLHCTGSRVPPPPLDEDAPVWTPLSLQPPIQLDSTKCLRAPGLDDHRPARRWMPLVAGNLQCGTLMWNAEDGCCSLPPCTWTPPQVRPTPPGLGRVWAPHFICAPCSSCQGINSLIGFKLS